MKTRILLTVMLALLLQGKETAMADETTNAQRAQEFFNKLNKDNLELVDKMYAKNVVFEDPAGRVEGLTQLRKYFDSMYENTIEITFDFSDVVEVDKTAFLTWKMTFRNKKLKGGKPIEVSGTSHLKFDDEGKIAYHRDYFDLGEMVYEHIFFVGWLVRKVKGKIAAH